MKYTSKDQLAPCDWSGIGPHLRIGGYSFVKLRAATRHIALFEFTRSGGHSATDYWDSSAAPAHSQYTIVRVTCDGVECLSGGRDRTEELAELICASETGETSIQGVRFVYEVFHIPSTLLLHLK